MQPQRQDPAAAARRRRGVVAVVAAILMPVLVGAVALAVDTGVLFTARAQLQTSTDAAALAGAARMAERQRLQAHPIAAADVAAARTQAAAFAEQNRVLGKPTVLQTGAGGDVTVGYLSRPFDPTQPLRTDAQAIPYYNAVQVRAARSAGRGDPIPSFFSMIWGRSGADVQATSTAAVVGVSGFGVNGGANADLLPIVLDKNTFASMIRGETTDQFSYNPATRKVTPGADGVAESKLYPVSNGYPGNWGTINVGTSNNSTKTLGDQIRHGITPAQLARYPQGVLQPNPATGLIQFGGDPGISAGIKDDLAAIIGKPVRVPIFDPALSGGNGNNVVYTIVGFVPATILKVNFQGKDKHVIIQPVADFNDPTIVWGGIRDGPMTGQFRLVLVR